MSLNALKQVPLDDSPASSKARLAIFKQFDVNGNEYISLAEIEKGFRDILNVPEYFNSKPVLMRAYQAAKNKLPVKNGNKFGEDYVSKGQFKYLFIYLSVYYQLWDDFRKIDTSKDRRLSEVEFTKGIPSLSKWGIIVNNAHNDFQAILKAHNQKEFITFTDFCDWALGKHMAKYPQHNDHEQI